MNEIENWYDNVYDEWDRLERHRIEFDITKRYLDKYITGKNLKIFDIGGGPGRYSLYLAKKGHRVSLLDLSAKNIEVAKEKAKESNLKLEEYIHGNALKLEEYQQEYDVILLMGPLYHLIKESDRKRAVEGALKLLKPGGIIYASFISKYAPIQDNLLRLNEIDNVQELLDYLMDGENKEDSGFTTAYFSGPEEAVDLMSDFQIKKLDFAGVENVLGCREKEICMMPEEQYNKWLEIGYKLSTDKNVIGVSHHFLYIGQKE